VGDPVLWSMKFIVGGVVEEGIIKKLDDLVLWSMKFIVGGVIGEGII